MATYGTAIYNGTTYTLYGFPGSTLRDELNRLANGGNAYPALSAYLDVDGAANKWAGLTGSNVVAASAALNYKFSGGSRKHPDYKDMNGVCNELAGISPTNNSLWVEAVTALRLVQT